MGVAERKNGHRLGIHRVLDKHLTLPQSAKKIDNSLPIFDNEILIEVERLNIDAASFVQMEKESQGNKEKIASIILENCASRGKQENAVTGSGGMLVGTVKQIGSRYDGALKLKPGQRIATLVSLTLTPLHLDSIGNMDLKTHQIEVKGHAVLFESGIAAKIPEDLPEKVAMAVFDVAGAPATVFGNLKRGQTLIVIGAGGKAGCLAAVAGREKLGRSGKVIAIEPSPVAAADLKELGVCNEVFCIDATDPIAVQSSIEKATRGKMGDVVISVASAPNTEVSSLLSVKSKGKIIFFSMATSFSKVTLGAEGISSDATLIFGNGYYPGHAQFAIGLLKKHKALRELFLRRYS